MTMLWLTLLLPATVMCGGLKEELLSHKSAPTLRRVVVLARHGSKVPDPRIVSACPAFGKTQAKFLSEQQSTPNELTPNGFKELYNAGQFARHRYVDGLRVLPSSFYLNNTVSFSSQRSAFCLQSTTAFGKGMYPDGTGPPGFLPQKPQILPVNVPYGLPGVDVLFNCRDGPCSPQWEAGKAKYSTGAALEKLKKENKELLDKVSKACGGGADYAKMPGLLDQIKFLDDDITWAEESGLSGDLDGKMNKDTLAKFHELAYSVVKNTYVGFGEQLAVTACGFPSKLLSLLHEPSDGVVKFDFFLNHREMLYGMLEAFFFQEFTVPGHFPGFVLTGSSIFFELHKDAKGKFLQIYMYVPEGGGQVLQLLPKSCDAKRCPLETMEDNFAQFVKKNGDIQKMCVNGGGDSVAFASEPMTVGTAGLGAGVVLALLVGVFIGRTRSASARTGAVVYEVLPGEQ